MSLPLDFGKRHPCICAKCTAPRLQRLRADLEREYGPNHGYELELPPETVQ